ncbi:hypothetical protein GCM10011391_09940 [Pullulanibacillus camelliae]|uniref:Uncharacterized protein n=1 Tax=Pullulanibacillus camelliae TaxID=1707096 RepID=A0A8J2YDA3_9BACL|nr:hypothetical protein GCM10011391_09940 [Pullulanibacillus camelliae]
MSQYKKGYFYKVTNLLYASIKRGGSAMGMSVSLKKATNKTNIKHNNLDLNDKEKERNAHIDYSE